jgi:Phosphotransferase enzyme family.
LPGLINASEAFPAGGSQLLHFDVRSDNLCFSDGRVLLVDWNLAAVGNARLDIAFWLPSLADEGGPQPDVVLPDAGPEASIVSGFFAARAGRQPIPTAPRVRTVQLAQLRQALPWACRALGCLRRARRSRVVTP